MLTLHVLRQGALADLVLQVVRELQALAGNSNWNCVPSCSVPIWTVCLVVIWIVWFLSVISALLTWP